MNETPIYDAVADKLGFNPEKMKGIQQKLTSFEGMKRRKKLLSETPK